MTKAPVAIFRFHLIHSSVLAVGAASWVRRESIDDVHNIESVDNADMDMDSKWQGVPRRRSTRCGCTPVGGWLHISV